MIISKLKSKKFVILFPCLLVLIFTFSFLYNLFLVGNNQGKDSSTIIVKSGTTLTELTQQLKNKEVIDAPLTFYLWGRLTGFSTKIQDGIYYIPKHLNVITTMKYLKEVQYVRITIPEGYTIPEIAKLIAEKTTIKEADFLTAAKTYTPYPYMKEGLTHKDIKFVVEGFLFPDTYDIPKNGTPEDIMKIMIDNFDKKLTPEMRQIATSENLTIYQLITLASLVEKEAKYPEDRPQIAQVFFKRLAINMPLQSDATIQYVLPNHKEDFTIADTKFDSPYNTYLHYGLTPGPIGNPGLSSIEAVLHPTKTDYLYFVADQNGHNHYSQTYEAHEDNIGKIYKENK